MFYVLFLRRRQTLITLNKFRDDKQAFERYITKKDEDFGTFIKKLTVVITTPYQTFGVDCPTLNSPSRRSSTSATLNGGHKQREICRKTRTHTTDRYITTHTFRLPNSWLHETRYHHNSCFFTTSPPAIKTAVHNHSQPLHRWYDDINSHVDCTALWLMKSYKSHQL